MKLQQHKNIIKNSITALFLIVTVALSGLQIINADDVPPADWAFEESSKPLHDVILEKYPDIDTNEDGYISISEANSYDAQEILIQNRYDLTGTIHGMEHFNKVININLSFNSLTGTIPKEIAHLNSMRFLRLNANYFYGSIAKDFGENSNVLRYDFSDNNLEGEIPLEFKNLNSTINIIEITNNNIISIPSDMYNAYIGHANSYFQSQSYSKNIANGKMNNDYTFETLPIFEQVQYFNDESSIMYMLKYPADNNVRMLTSDDISFDFQNQKATINSSNFKKAGQYTLSATIDKGKASGSNYEFNFEVLNSNEYQFISAVANGESNTQTSTKINLTFDQVVQDLSVDDISLSNNDINKDSLTTLSNGAYELAISGDWENEDVIDVSIAQDGSAFTPNSQQVSLYVDNSDDNIDDKDVDDNIDDKDVDDNDENDNVINNDIPKTGLDSPLTYVLAFITSIIFGFIVVKNYRRDN